MLIKKVAIITCFSYSQVPLWRLKMEYPLSDLKMIFDYCFSEMMCDGKKIYILTDMDPHTILHRIEGYEPQIIKIRSNLHYQQSLLKILSEIQIDEKLFFYYTGHGGNGYLMIPNHSDIDRYYSMEKLLTSTPCEDIVAVFDCCHAESIINILRWRHSQRIILVASSTIYQTCGFFHSQEEKGSLFTYFFFKYLRGDPCRSIKNLWVLEDDIVKYRIDHYKPSQNIRVISSEGEKSRLPEWLFPSQWRVLLFETSVVE